MERLADLTDEIVRRPSRLPGWTVGHVLTHLARNAGAHARRLDGSRSGRDLEKYPGGAAQRQLEIGAGANRPAALLLQDLRESNLVFERAVQACAVAGWPNGQLLGGSTYPVLAAPAHRLRELEMHHVDLGLGYEPHQWPDEYIAWELPNLLASANDRILEAGERRRMAAWLAGRGSIDGSIHLEPW